MRQLAYLATLSALVMLIFAPTVLAQPEEDLYDCSDFDY